MALGNCKYIFAIGRQRFMRQHVLLRLRQEILDPEVETVLHPSPFRFKILGFLTLFGQLIFWFIWAVLLPQPYENIYIRLLIAFLGIGIFLEKVKSDGTYSGLHLYTFTVNWLQLPVFFTWMYWMNNGSAVWLASMASMILIYYHFTDWRLATLGILAGMPIATGIAYWQLQGLITIPLDAIAVLAFCFFAAIAFGASNANLRRERLRHSLVVIGIMAHELRTPLATASLISQAIAAEATNNDEKSRIRGLNKLAKKLELLTRTINHHIDVQMMNARLMQLPKTKQMISATGLVNKVVTQYPFSTKKEEDSLELVVHEDFLFFGSERQFVQVLNNVIKNALYSLKAAQSRFEVGDLHIELGSRSGIGRIAISDKGLGISPENVARIFEPFFSTSNDTGHGLGLAYCKQVVDNAGGSLRVRSQPAEGATFTIEIPIQTIAKGDPSHHALSSISST
jgi:two-component system, CAI-1 autoinducer sensor kinase/phosphatase CqsS